MSAASVLKTVTAVYVAALGVASSPVHAQPADSLQMQVDKVFALYDKPDSPGCALGLIRDGAFIYRRGYGSANLELGVPITTKTVFDIGSTSKQFTAASIVLLAQQGKLALDDDIRKYVPEMPTYSRPVTIRHLLHHTSGIRDYLTLMSLRGVATEDLTDDEDALSIITKQKEINFSPGDEHLYSNSGYFLLSVIVKRASGKTLREFARENIFEPLGMHDTHFHDDHTMIVRGRATGYAPKEGGGFQIDMSDFEQTGDGAVMTTVEDLFRWDQNFYRPVVGGQAMVNQLQATGTLSGGKALTYAFGLSVSQYRGLPAVSHGGAWAGYRAELLRFPGENLSVICLCNLGNSNPGMLSRKVAEIYLAGKLGPAPSFTPRATSQPDSSVRRQ
jgi:CubicO group peptidase (beta-lactamase class C family)